MDLLKCLAAQSKLSQEDIKLVSQVSKEDIKAWLKSHQQSQEYVSNLQLLMTLHGNDQLQITTYLQFCYDSDRFGDLICVNGTQQISEISSPFLETDPPSDENMRMASDVLNILIPFWVEKSKLMGPLLSFLRTVMEELPYNRLSVAPLIPYLVKSPYRGVPWHLHEFLEALVKISFSIDRDETSKRPTHEEFLSCQKEEFKKLHGHHQYLFFVEVLKVLTFHETTGLVDSLINHDLLSSMMLYSAFLHTRGEQNIDWFHKFIDAKFKSALSKGNIEDEDETYVTIRWLLIIRHLCLEQVKSQYTSYAHWFSSLQIKSREEFEYFFAVLSKLVPHETAMTLKIHINKAPAIPPNCQTIFSDYSQLARTQLIDMHETTEYMGLFGTTELEDRREDVRKVLSHFRQTGEIAPILLKACVFRREYFRDIFLRDLLGFREADDAWRDAQRQLVQALRDAGKLPRAMYEEWASKSEQKL